MHTHVCINFCPVLFLLKFRSACGKAMDTEEYSAGRGDIANKITVGELLLHDKTTSRCRIWRVFTRVTNQEGVELDFVCCKTCQRIYKYNHSQTSNLCRHSCYVEKFANAENDVSILEEEKPKIQTIEVTVSNVTQLLTKWIIQNCHSYDLLQSEGLKAVFQELLKLGAKFGGDLDVGKFLPSSSEISNNISDVYNRLFASIKQEISLVKEHGFGLTADIWADNLSHENYIALTIHYLKSGVLTYRLLGFQLLEDVSIANRIAKVEDILEEFDLQLSEKYLFVTNGSFDSIKPFKDAQNLPCISQLLNNTVVESVKEVPEVLQIINSCFGLVNFLGKKGPTHLSRQLSHKSHHNHSVTICKMLNTVVIHLSEIEQALQDMQETQIVILNKNKILAILNVLQPFEEAIQTLEDNSHATLHLVMAYMQELRKSCQTAADNSKRYACVKQLQENICLKLDEIVAKNITNLHKIAVFLYPPTNKLLPFSDKDKQLIEDECMRLLKSYKIETKPLIKQEPDEQQSSATACKQRKLLADFLESETLNDINEIMRQELQNYKNTRVVFSSNFNVFNWWETQKDNFPLLYRLSCTILTTPSTSVATKRVFSNVRSLLSDKYSQHSTNLHTEKIIFVNTNAPGVELDGYFTS